MYCNLALVVLSTGRKSIYLNTINIITKFVLDPVKGLWMGKEDKIRKNQFFIKKRFVRIQES